MPYNRYKNEDTSKPATLFRVVTRSFSAYYNAWAPDSGTNVILLEPFVKRSLSGYDIPNFHKQVRSGALLPFTDFEQTYCELKTDGTIFDTDDSYQDSFGTVHECFVGTATGTNLFGVGGSYGDPYNITTTPEDPSYFVNEALSKLYTSGFDAGTFMATWKQTYRLLFQVHKRLRNILNHPTGMNLADSWLEYRYGWRLLYYDMKSLAKAISSLSSAKHSFYKQRSGGEKTGPCSYSVNYYTPVVPSTDVQMFGTYRSNSWASVVTKTAPPDFLFDPFITAIDLVKYGFIIDWIFDVSSWVAAQRSVDFSREMVIGYGTFVEENFLASFVPLSRERYSRSGGQRGSATLVRNKTTRHPVQSVDLPGLRVNLDFQKVLDLIALTMQIMNRRRR